MIFCYAHGKEVVGEQLEEQVGFPATTDAGNYLYQTITLTVNQLLEIFIAFSIYGILNFCRMCQLFQVQKFRISPRTPNKWHKFR